MSNLLVVDWGRLTGAAGPDVTLVNFWDRFHIHEDSILCNADCNAKAIAAQARCSAYPTEQVWLYDTHHDAGYWDSVAATDEEGIRHFSCENWMVGYHLLGAKLHVRYSQWKTSAFDEPDPLVAVDRRFDDGHVNPVVFDTVFVCRSGAPSSRDIEFWGFITDAPVSELYSLDDSFSEP